ncbi:hypothetical protein P154DRAFT_152639 [Amniculicola lignicola CBS 123094]|uniref:Zn(2)-C6 fungal-type domain-containing protein n=1 Tax=Amniculicola lignicola CBS 123094 TaxID=1392246 RepID=A0A6A5W583_9PLEO|nr:hypothetical protein P154DRAFT_152639 [Amniculicola lignicola CBS 123094]
MASESEGTAHTPGATGKAAAAADNKPKRVRTGCLTCRERHLKCDEGLPTCQNCKKSNRNCKRGIRLNFIDTQVQTPPVLLPRTAEFQVAFLDESRDIASEYKGGSCRYPPAEVQRAQPPPPDNTAFYMDMSANMAQMPPPTSSAPQSLPPIQGILPHHQEEPQDLMYEQLQPSHPHHHHTHSHTESTYSSSTLRAGGATSYDASLDGPRDYLQSQEEVLFMQVFVEEVGLWMDSMDSQKHFSRLLPFHALSEPMLLNAFLACGARHLSLVNPKYNEDKALHYYDTATRHLLNSLQNPNRDTVLCATTAVILNVYEIMCERALQRMNHIAGARALIKECGWNARSTGVGAACFWLNVGMELLSCLHFNWQVAWDPDEWGLDMNVHESEIDAGREELWTHRILYVVAKVANFRASIPRTRDQDARVEQMRLHNRFNEWKRIKDLAEEWNRNIPRTMHPMAYLYPGQTLSGSAFPEVWLIKRSSIVARLFYHTCMCLLAQINPIMGLEQHEMSTMQHEHSQMICGISAHVKDRGVASVALRSLAIAAECLTTRREQEEVLSIFDKIRQETGWQVGFLNKELKEKWGWNNQDAALSAPQMPNGNMQYQQTVPHPQTMAPNPAVPVTSAAPRRPPTGILNPMYATADFSLPQHPYQTHYVAPNPTYQAPNPPNGYPSYY